ncbi:carboxypeptidase regulatory-like domain-containing protein [Corynebacterium diphtheriae]|uniref:SpaA fimbrial minor subunit SpaB n=1 Tax=Corynebacterium diphtheriae TaxID=1717 RepID=UPI0013CBE19B|nr:SpaA fimbrial minor subunit SpaB [Corynebacterium diphtheriae]MBG9338579.1 SpaA fimbrial minor subunit SpaB [Corynebacterium diphtheriae bv. mitis]CAB0566408.1 carboxypeptidase regulatory-like domain-containing protein [Corynebacterium diphtheriae]CAB0568319.1 carboxypeptidase regulatory-like domain-containing protein [Corynebacterium diphtheriae]CAB0915980.1 carboxypeptidase regulatory-like domain-containing protein [Corynebacterium diphtheriae]
MKNNAINAAVLSLALLTGTTPAHAQEANTLVIDLEPPAAFADDQPQGHNIDVTVAKLHNIDPEDHERIRDLQRNGVPSTISEEQPHTARTDATGTATITNLPPGAYVIRDSNTTKPRFSPLVIPLGIDTTSPTMTLRPKLIDVTPGAPNVPSVPSPPSVTAPAPKKTPPRLAFTGASILGLLAIATISTLIGIALLRTRRAEKKG